MHSCVFLHAAVGCGKLLLCLWFTEETVCHASQGRIIYHKDTSFYFFHNDVCIKSGNSRQSHGGETSELSQILNFPSWPLASEMLEHMIYIQGLLANSHTPQVVLLIFPLQPGLMWTSHHCDDGMETSCLHMKTLTSVSADSFHKSPVFLSEREFNCSGVKAAFTPGNLNVRSVPGNICCM